MVPFQRSISRIKITGRCKNQIFTVRTEYRGRGIIPLVCHRVFFLFSQIININDTIFIVPCTGISQPLAIRRKSHSPRLARELRAKNYMKIISLAPEVL